MNEAEIAKLVRSLTPLIPDLYKAVDEFDEEIVDTLYLSSLKTVNNLREIVDFLKDRLSEDPEKIPPPRNPNVIGIKKPGF